MLKPTADFMSKKLWISLAALLVAALVIYRFTHRAAAAQAGAHGGAGAPVIVVAGKVRRQDMPIYLNGIGTVNAFNSVTVRSQLDGQLKQVAFAEGQDVKAGDLLAQLDDRVQRAQLDQAQAKKAQDSALLTNAKSDQERDAYLFERQLIDQQTNDTQKALVLQLQAGVQADEAGVEAAQVQLDFTRITAPIAGRTGLRQVDQGNVVHTSDANGLVVITQLKPISVVFTLPQQNWPEIQRLTAAGQSLKVIAFDRDSLSPLDEGVLTVVDNQIDPTTGTIKLKATFPNEKLVLWPGQFVNIRLLVETRANGVVVPASVVQRGPQGAFAFVIKADATVEVRPLQVGPIEAGLALIDHGLEPGESVVVDGQYKLQAGSKVTVSAPAAPADPAAKPARHKRPAS